ncbi:MAG: amidase [Spirochaeta sp.]|nr:amidase [Spirochaeta sp.]RPG06364.1 MAG: amidase [Proteobacteria bacterium TMED72]
MSDLTLHYETASHLAHLIRKGELSARELMEAQLARIDQVNPHVNAIVTLQSEVALEKAREADEYQASGGVLGPLHGLPIAHKDLLSTAGMRTTFGSLLMKNFVPDRDDSLVIRLREAGAIALGKTNVPEFGAGSQTFNEVFGETRNPWDLSRTCGGSSGGAAVALSTGMVPIADGSDMGGSLRNPASFCHVVGLRPSPGRVPVAGEEMAWETLSVLGPMARNVEDVALLLSAMAGPDPACPISLDTPGDFFRQGLERDFTGVKVAWSPDFGVLPVDPAVRKVTDSARSVAERVGCEVMEADADWSGADEAFKTLRAWTFAQAFGSLSDEKKALLKDTVRWNLDAGLSLSGQDVARAQVFRSRLYARVAEFMEEYEFLILPVSQVPPFDVETRYPEEVEGVLMETYVDWMKSAYFVSALGLPALSLPFGFTEEGLPVGIQIVGRNHDDFGVLQLARALEECQGVSAMRPPLEAEGA